MPSFLWRSCIIAVFLVASEASLAAGQGTPPAVYLDPHRPVAERADDLARRMTLDEKISQMQSAAPAIPRLYIQAYDWWNEALHGVARSGYATVFPQAIGLASTWDPELIRRIGDTIAIEARAKYNQAQREGNHSIFYGLTFWSPNVNIDRDPRWGRGQETYGEDPFLTGQIGAAFVRGLQGDNPDAPKVIATAKHFAVHSGPETERHGFNAVVSPHDLADTYLPAFRDLVVNAHASSVMCAYNAVDNQPACASPMLLADTLRKDWNFRGYIVSDCAAITDVATGHHFAPDMAHAAAASVKAGTDLSCGKEYASLKQAVEQGLITEAEIDISVKRLFTARIELGMFDPSASSALNSLPPTEIDSPQHRALALEAAHRSIVLLKDANNLLPLAKNIRTLAVVGPNAATLASLEGNYNAVPSNPVTPLAALQARLPGRILYAQGSPFVEGAMLPIPETAFSTIDNGKSVPGLTGEYFDGLGFEKQPTLRRIDPHIDFDWNSASPVPGLSRESFSVRWTGQFTPVAPGITHLQFTLAHCSTCNDAETIRVWIDNTQVYEFLHPATPGRHGPTPPFEVILNDIHPHSIRIEYTHQAPLFGAGLAFTWSPSPEPMRSAAVQAARNADAVVAFLGLSPELEGEEMPVKIEGFNGGDRTTIELPHVQQQLVDALANTGKPIILVLMSGGAVALGNSADQASAVLAAWYPGEAGGTAIADTLFGENNPSGRLPVTFYASTSQLPAFDNYSMADRTYRFFNGEPLYRFGDGLSYSSFLYSKATLSSTRLHAGDALAVSATIANTSRRDGDEVSEIYLTPPRTPGASNLALVGVQGVHIAHGGSATVEVRIDPRQLSTVDEDGTRRILPGNYNLWVGSAQPGKGPGLSLPFTIEGSLELAP